jgi:hypothetical protein
MRKFKIIEHISLDGVIQAPGGASEDGDCAELCLRSFRRFDLADILPCWQA